MQKEHHFIEKEQNLMVNQISPAKHINEAQNNSIEALAIHPSHSSFATGSHDHNIKLWNLETFK